MCVCVADERENDKIIFGFINFDVWPTPSTPFLILFHFFPIGLYKSHFMICCSVKEFHFEYSTTRQFSFGDSISCHFVPNGVQTTTNMSEQHFGTEINVTAFLNDKSREGWSKRCHFRS